MADSMASSWNIEAEYEDGNVRAFRWPGKDTFCREIAFSDGVQPLRDFASSLHFNNGEGIGRRRYITRKDKRTSQPFVCMHIFKTFRIAVDVQLFNEPLIDFDQVVTFIDEHFPTVQIKQHNVFVGGFSLRQTYGFTLTGDEFVGPAFFWATALYRDGEINVAGFNGTLSYPVYYPKIMLFASLGPLYIAAYDHILNHSEKLAAAAEYIAECGGFINA